MRTLLSVRSVTSRFADRPRLGALRVIPPKNLSPQLHTTSRSFTNEPSSKGSPAGIAIQNTAGRWPRSPSTHWIIHMESSCSLRPARIHVVIVMGSTPVRLVLPGYWTTGWFGTCSRKGRGPTGVDGLPIAGNVMLTATSTWKINLLTINTTHTLAIGLP